MHLIKKSWKKLLHWVRVIIERIIVNCRNISQYYSFYDIWNKIRHFKNTQNKKILQTSNFWMVMYFIFIFNLLQDFNLFVCFMVQGTSDFCVAPDKFLMNQTKDAISSGECISYSECMYTVHLEKNSHGHIRCHLCVHCNIILWMGIIVLQWTNWHEMAFLHSQVLD